MGYAPFAVGMGYQKPERSVAAGNSMGYWNAPSPLGWDSSEP